MSALPQNPLLMLSDEMVVFLPFIAEHYPGGVPLRALGEAMGVDWPHIRKAAVEASESRKIWLMRRGRSFIVSQLGAMIDLPRVCIGCGTVFDAPKAMKNGRMQLTHRATCSHSCRNRWSWRKPQTRAKRGEGIRAAFNTEEARLRLAAHNNRRWSKPGERERLSEQNRREWRDPVKSALRAQSIKAVNGSPEMRKFYSDLRKEWWADPTMRQKMQEAVSASQSTQEYRQKLSLLVKERWRDPVWREKWTRANRARAGNRKGMKQSPEHVAKRVKSTGTTKAAKVER